MAIKSRNKVEPTFNSSSMSDLVFLLLIFFMLTSTLIAPNAIKLLLPSSDSKTMDRQSVNVYIKDLSDGQVQYQVNDTPAEDESQLYELIKKDFGNDPQATVMLHSDKTVPVQHIVDVINAVNNINKEDAGNNHKVLLATTPK